MVIFDTYVVLIVFAPMCKGNYPL